jgi:hypothetical protein
MLERYGTRESHLHHHYKHTSQVLFRNTYLLGTAREYAKLLELTRRLPSLLRLRTGGPRYCMHELLGRTKGPDLR